VTTQEAINYFRSKSALAAALGIEPPSVYGWKEYPPALRQLQLEELTGGALRAEANCRPPAKEAA
jgi:hypothetical protein